MSDKESNSKSPNDKDLDELLNSKWKICEKNGQSVGLVRFEHFFIKNENHVPN